MTQRILSDNAVLESEITLSASSEEPTMPVEFLLDQVPSKTWRTLTGWTIVAGFNDVIDWMRGASGPFAATLTPGNYASGTALAAHIESRMEATDVAQPFYTVAYNISTHKFSIAHASALNITLLWNSGANAGQSPGFDLGFDASQDSISDDSHTATSASYQSRHYVVISRSDGERIPVSAVGIVNHNVPPELYVDLTNDDIGSSRQPLRLQGNDTNSWADPDYSEAVLLAENGEELDPAIQYGPIFTSTELDGFIFYRLLVNAVGDSSGYFELGILYLGGYLQPTVKIEAVGLANSPEDFSTLTVAIDGTHYVDRRRNRNRWNVLWKVAGPTDTANFRETFRNIAIGDDFFLHLITTDKTSAKYGYFPERPRENYLSSVLVSFAMTFCEAL